MILYIVECKDCKYNREVFGEDVAQGKAWNHGQKTGHEVEYNEQ